jgi:hypothetical protein
LNSANPNIVSLSAWPKLPFQNLLAGWTLGVFDDGAAAFLDTVPKYFCAFSWILFVAGSIVLPKCSIFLLLSKLHACLTTITQVLQRKANARATLASECE